MAAELAHERKIEEVQQKEHDHVSQLNSNLMSSTYKGLQNWHEMERKKLQMMKKKKKRKKKRCSRNNERRRRRLRKKRKAKSKKKNQAQAQASLKALEANRRKCRRSIAVHKRRKR